MAKQQLKELCSSCTKHLWKPHEEAINIWWVRFKNLSVEPCFHHREGQPSLVSLHPIQGSMWLQGKSDQLNNPVETFSPLALGQFVDLTSLTPCLQQKPHGWARAAFCSPTYFNVFTSTTKRVLNSCDGFAAQPKSAVPQLSSALSPWLPPRPSQHPASTFLPSLLFS